MSELRSELEPPGFTVGYRPLEDGVSGKVGATQGALAEGFVRKHLVHFGVFKLTLRNLEAAYPDIADAMTLHDASKVQSVRLKSMTLEGKCQSIADCTLS